MIDRAASRENFLRWASTPQFAAIAKEREGLPVKMIIGGVLMGIVGAIWSDVVAGWGIIFVVVGFIRRYRARNRPPEILTWIHGFEIIPCAIVIANSQALATPNSRAPAALVGGFSPETPGYLEALATVAGQAGQLYGSPPGSVPLQLKETCVLINDDTYHEARRRPVPAQIASGQDLLFFDAILESSYFQSQKIDVPFVFMAAARESGPIYHVPYELIVWTEVR